MGQRGVERGPGSTQPGFTANEKHKWRFLKCFLPIRLTESNQMAAEHGGPIPRGKSGLAAGGPHRGVKMQNQAPTLGSSLSPCLPDTGACAMATGCPGALQPPQAMPLHCPLLPHPQIIMARVSAVCPFGFFSVPITFCRCVCSPLNYDKCVLSFLSASSPAAQQPTLGKTAPGPFRSRPQRRCRGAAGLSGYLGKAVVFYSTEQVPRSHAGIRGVHFCHPAPRATSGTGYANTRLRD